MIQAHGFAETPTLAEIAAGLPALAPNEEGGFRTQPVRYFRRNPKAPGAPSRRDPVIQSSAPSLNIPSPGLTFEGINNNCSCTPPDPNGDIGPSNYVQTVNVDFQVFNKFTGATQSAILPINSLFSGLGGPCAADNDGDPIVLYDPLADRWLIAQFAVATGPPYFMAIAISKTADPTGAYYAYCFNQGTLFNDYPKLGVWPDGYYMTDNQFNGNTFAGAGVYVFDRAKMLVGDPTAVSIYFDVAAGDPTIGGMLPSDLDGPPPPVGTPNYFAYYTSVANGDPQDGLRVFEFHADFVNTNLTTFVERPDSPIAVAAFNPNVSAIPQPGTAQALDTLADRLMHRLQYRNFGTNESLVVTHTVVGGSGQAGIRYYQLRRNLPGGNFTVNEQATFAPDSTNRWMGSAAMNYQGDLAVGYSASSSALFPSIRYAARLASDPPGGLFQGEGTLQTGAGSQTSTADRWGDYSALTVDPSDDATFWYTTEYYSATSAASWRTRIGKFQVATNTPPAPKGTIGGAVTDGGTGLPISNAVVRTTSGFFRVSNTSGGYSMTVPPGIYDMSAFVTGHGTVTASGVGVTNGATTSQNFVFPPLPAIITTNGAAITSESCTATNGAIDPGETVTVNFALKNVGGSNTVGLVATLQATGGVMSPSSPQTYGVLIAGGASVAKPFTFTANGNCGGSITNTLQLQDGAANLGTVTYTFNLGMLATPLSQNFDGVTAPALPAGWTTSAGGAESAWVTSTTQRDTLPNAAFSPDPGAIGSNALVSPVIPIATSTAKLTFRNNYSLETSFDGGVLEVKIGGGAFQDILTAGGSFAQNGYTATISTSYSNPLGGRSAWSGSSGGFITTTVNLPAAAAGQNIQLQWRCGSDNSVSAGGWYIDTISINDGFSCCTGVVNHVPVITAASISPVSPTTTNILTVTGISTNDPDGDPITLAYQWQQSTNNVTFTNIAFVADTLPAAATIAGDYYRVSITPNDGHTNGAPFTTASVLVPIDADGNGINDDWEVQYFGHIGINPIADADGTGQNNLFKYVTGLDPTNPASVFIFQIATITNQPSQDNLLFHPLAGGRTYTPQFNTDLVNGAWLTLTGYLGPVTNGNQVTITDTNATAPNKFYRLDISVP